MSDAAWKRDERCVAEFFGTYRAPLSGGNSRHSGRDTLHPTHVFEVKSRSAVPSTWFAITRLLEEVEQRAAVEKKRAILVAHRKHVRNVADGPAYLRVVDGELAATVVGGPLSVVRSRFTRARILALPASAEGE